MEYGISLGSNLGNRLAFIEQAIVMIAKDAGYSIIAEASVYETAPVDVPAEYANNIFFNTAIVIETNDTPENVLKKLHEIETKLGRKRGEIRNIPRPIDLDIIYAGNIELDTEELIIPHPRWAERRFVVAPLAEIRPNLIIGNTTLTVKEILASLPETPTVKKLKR